MFPSVSIDRELPPPNPIGHDALCRNMLENLITQIAGTRPKGCVLIVDDEPAIAEFLAMKFEQAGYRAIVASNGAEAVDQLKVERPDLVISDMHMPFVDGLELCRWLASSDSTSSVPVILLSAQSFECAAELHSSIAWTISKPFSAALVVTRSIQLIESHRATRAGRQHSAAGDL